MCFWGAKDFVLFIKVVMGSIFLFQIEIVLGKTDNFDELMAAEAEQRDYVENEDQNWNMIPGVFYLSSLLLSEVWLSVQIPK